jgi:hypothetical protein
MEASPAKKEITICRGYPCVYLKKETGTVGKTSKRAVVADIVGRKRIG